MINSESSPSHEEQLMIDLTASGFLIMAERIVVKWDESAQFLSATWAKNAPFFDRLFKFAEDNSEFFSDDLRRRFSAIDTSFKRFALMVRDQGNENVTTPVSSSVQI